MFDKRFSQLDQTVKKCVYSSRTKIITSDEALAMAHFLLKQAKAVEGIIYVIGNGGSAGIASHFMNDLLRTLNLAAATLSDSNLLTCFSNDYGYEKVYELPLRHLMRPKDLLVALSSSGQSENILRAAQVAKELKAPLITLSGFAAENPLRQLGDLNFWVESCDYGLVEMSHFFLLHTIVDTFSRTGAHARQNQAV